MGKTIEYERKIATKDGFYGSRRVRVGQTFTAPVEETGAWFESTGEGAAPAASDTGGDDLLDKTVPEIVDALPRLSLDELRNLFAAEQAGKTRKGLLAKIGDAITNAETNPPTGKGDDDLMS